MRSWQVPVRITRTKKCREGFFLLVNGSRLRFTNRAAAVDAIDALLSMQRIQVVTVREFAERKKHRIKVPAAPAGEGGIG